MRTPAKNILLARLVENKGDPKKAKKEKGELILGKLKGESQKISVLPVACIA